MKLVNASAILAVSKRYALWSVAAASIMANVACSHGIGANWSGGGQLDSASVSGGGSGASALSNSYETQAIAIIQTNCTGCHTASSGPSNIYDLTDAGHLVSSGLIVPGSASQSTLYTQISSGSMPPSGSLSAADIATINSWITATASTGSGPTAGPTPNPGASLPTVNFSTINASIFQAKCVSCHTTASPAGGYALDTYAGVLAAVNVAYPTISPVYVQTSTAQMPKGGAALAASDETALLTWIEQGALNN